MDQIENILKTLKSNWHSPVGLLAGNITALTFVSLLVNYINPAWWWFLICWALTVGVITIVWLVCRRCPRADRGKVGIAIALYSDEEDKSALTRVDFISALREQLQAGASGSTFHVFEIPQWRARLIQDIKAATALRRKCKAAFVFYGTVRRRGINNDDTAVIKLNGLVSHAPIPQAQGKHLQEEFTKILPGKVLLDRKNELVAVEFTSQWAGVVAKYIIGLAAALSGDLAYAESLLSEVRIALPAKDSRFHIFTHIRAQVPQWLTQIYFAQSKQIYGHWLKSRDVREIERLMDLFQKLERHGCDREPFIPLMALSVFVKERNVKKATALLLESKCSTHPISFINRGFLEAYGGNLKRACQLYRQAAKHGLEPSALIGEIETFQDWILTQDPEKYQLYFSLGFLNFHLKGDSQRAREDLREFLARCPKAKYTKERDLAKQWLESIESESDAMATVVDGATRPIASSNDGKYGLSNVVL